MSFKPSYYHCYKGKKYICSGTLEEIASFLQLSILTVKSYAYGAGKHAYQLYRNDPRARDLYDMKVYQVGDFEDHKIEQMEY